MDELSLDEVAERKPARTRRAQREAASNAVRLRLAGPLKGDYSLAVVNRHFALALIAAGCDVELISQETDLQQDMHFLTSGLASRLMHETRQGHQSQSSASVLSANDWPIRNPLPGQRMAMHCFAWEESILPFELATRLSRYNLVCTTASFVTRACINSGVTSPVVTIGNGTDHVLRPGRNNPLRRASDARPFRFLHISSCFPRKGIDVLLAAYFAEFTAADHVELMIKTFDNPHNQELRATIARLQAEHPNPPAIELNISSLEADRYYQLYAQADCLIAPSYGEGFLLPAAEAMLNNVPVITTRWGGQLDFCTDETAWLIDARLEPSKSHVAAAGGLWARPDLHHLRTLMRSMTRLSVEERANRLMRAQALLEKQFTWRDAARRFLEALQVISRSRSARSKTIVVSAAAKRHVVISTFDQRCGIATFTRELLRALPATQCIAGIVTEVADRDSVNPARFEPAVPVLPVWRRHSRYISDIVESTRRLHPDAVLIQHHPGLYSWDMLGGIVAGLAHHVPTTLQLHAASEGVAELRLAANRLQHAARFVVHNARDYVAIASLFGADRTSLIPHGIDAPHRVRVKQTVGTTRFASFGFAAPHKGFHKGIEAIAMLRQAGYDANYEIISALDPANDDARHYLKHCAELASRLGVADYVDIDPRFLPMESVLNRLTSCAGALLLYDDVNEGASGASRVMLRAGVPLLVSSSPIFSDLHAVARVVGTGTLALVREMKALIDAPELRIEQLTRQNEFVQATQWAQVAKMVFQHAG